jgi:glyoxalase family protein
VGYPRLLGLHHVTAIATDPQDSLDFYLEVLGLTLVKRTVNFDDPGTYHLYFGDADATPGSILTFFPWPGAHRGHVGNGQVAATSFAAPRGSFFYWHDRLLKRGIEVSRLGQRFGDQVLGFEDPDGLPLEIVETKALGPRSSQGPVPEPFALAGFHSVTLAEEGYERTAAMLQEVMGLRPVGNENRRFRYAIDDEESPASIVDVICAPAGPTGQLGAGTVHHLAWRTSNDADQRDWRNVLVRAGVNVSPVMDRRYFHSIYYREPGGILFEIATDAPGFATDEPYSRLGERLMLPPWLESSRRAIEATLPPLTMPGDVTHLRSSS